MPFYLDFLYRLRDYRVPVGTQEAIALAQALAGGLHGSSATGFYHVARALLIHHEGHLDAFDRAFAAHFAGIETLGPELNAELREWLDERREESGERPEAVEDFWTSEEFERIRALFEQRKAEQRERHDGGSHWIGTRGSSPFGQAGSSRGGFSTASSGGGRAALHLADARHYAGYRSDVVLDIRQLEVALRRLRAFVREGAAHELDMEATIDATARNAGDITVVTRPPQRPDTHVILLVDVGGSMYPYSQLMSELFSAARKATHFKELRTYSFHNCVYGRVYKTDQLTEPVWVEDLIRQCGSNYKLIIVGDAYMAPYELAQRGPVGPDVPGGMSGIEWLMRLADHFSSSVWLNPEPLSRWAGSTIEQVGAVFDMYPMTVDGLTEAMTVLNKGGPGRV